MKNLLRLIRTIMLTHALIQARYPTPTLPSWLKDFNGPVCIRNLNPDEDYCNAAISSTVLAIEAHTMSVLRNTTIFPRPPCDLLVPLIQ
jgi:hypothetical protein